jgi:hypothetical protein
MPSPSSLLQVTFMARRFAVTRRSSISLSIAAVAFCLALHATPLWSAGSASGAGQTQPVVGPSVFRVAPAVAVTGLPVAIVAGDLNNDGKVDLVIGNTSTGTVDVLLGDGKGNFQAPVRYKVGGAPVALALGDFRGHGKIDIAVANQSANSINILLGKGDGTFEAAATYSVGSSPTALAVGDLYGDGRSDLLVANTGSATLSVLKNNGDGTFQNAKFYSVGASARAIAVGDFNGDGKLDVATGNADGTVTILLNDGAGRLNGVSRLNATANVVSGLTAGDLNHDGKSDLAVVDSVANTVSVLLGNGDGTFHPSSVLSVGNQPASIALADVNGDAIPDLLVANKSGNTVSVMLGVGDGSFHASTEYVVGNSPASIVIADFNGDGHPDFATANSADGTVSTPLGNGDGTFTAAQDYRTHLERKSAAVGDLDGDGHPDLVVASFCGSDLKCTGNGTASVFLSDGKGGLKAGSIYSLGRGPVSIALADVNGDKKLDLIAVNRDENSAMVLLGNGDGTFQEGVAYPAGVSPVSVAVGDFNKDGKVDLAIVSLCGSAGCNQQGSVSFLLGNDDGSFKAGASYDVGFSPTSLAMGDLTGGGKLDVVVANACGRSSACSNSTATLLIGDGKGSFSLKGDLDLGRSVSSIALVDLKGHGKLDLVAANSADNKIGVLLGNGDGTFNRQVPYTVGNGPSAAIVADFNGDGRPDVAVANLKDSTVSLLAGNGDGTLQTAEVYPVGFGPDALVALDLDGSGRLAIVTANGNSGGSPAGNDITVLGSNAPPPAKTNTTTTLTSSINPSVFGQSVNFTAVVTGTGGPPTGTVQFKDGTNNLGTPVTLDITGKAVLSWSQLDVAGSPHAITAVYSGDVNFNGSTSNAVSQTVNPAQTTTVLTSAPNPSVYGQSVTFTAVVTAKPPGGGTPVGTVQFKDGANNLGSPVTLDNTGTATLNSSTLDVAGSPHSITAVYVDAVDKNYTGSTSLPVLQVVTKANTTTAVSSNHNPSVHGQPVTFSATVSAVAPGGGTPTGTVQLVIDGTNVGSAVPLTGGSASFPPISNLTTGSHTVAVIYSGDTNFLPSTGTLPTQTVNKADTTTALASSSNPSTYGQAITFTATVTATPPGAGIPTGTVTFKDTFNGVTTTLGTGTLDVAGKATYTTITCTAGTALLAGTHSITAIYGGDTDFNGSTSPALNQVVNKAPTVTTITSTLPLLPVFVSAGASVQPQTVSISAHAVVTSTPACSIPVAAGEDIDFTDTLPPNPPVVTAVLIDSSGNATYTSTTLPGGHHGFTANYAGDLNLQASPPSTSVNQDVWDFTSTPSLPTYTVPFGYSLPVPVTVQGIGGLWGVITNTSCPVPSGVTCSPGGGTIKQPAPGSDGSTVVTPVFTILGRSVPGRGPLSVTPNPFSATPGFTETPSQPNPLGTLTKLITSPPSIAVVTNPLPFCGDLTGKTPPSLGFDALQSDAGSNFTGTLNFTASFTCTAGLPIGATIPVSETLDTVSFTISWDNTPVSLGIPTEVQQTSQPQAFALVSQGGAAVVHSIQVTTIDVANGINVISAALVLNSPVSTAQGSTIVVNQPAGNLTEADGSPLVTPTTITLDSCLANGQPASKFAINCVYSGQGQYTLPTAATVQVTLSINNAVGNGQSRLPVAAWLGLLGGVFMALGGGRMWWRTSSKRQLALNAIAALGIVALMLSLGCGGGFNNTSQGNGTTPPGIYNVTIVGRDSSKQARIYSVVQLTVLKQ